MATQDARSLSAEVQEALRRRVAPAVRANVTSSLTNRGRSAFVVFREGFTATVFLRSSGA